jgi:two-component system sensor histidine kinase/response regulator
MKVNSPHSNESVKILIAEDSPTQAERLKHILSQQGYGVAAAPNGRQALDIVRKDHPTLVISDIVMPEMDGYQLCKAIKDDPALKYIPVILVTTLSDPQDVIRGLECHADNFIIKPYDEHYLLSRIQFVQLNRELRDQDHASMGVEIHFNGQRHFITADRLQILNLLLSTYEAAIRRNQELTRAKNELRSANAALESANKELESFSYSVSHDLRAPLRAISGFTEIVLSDEAQKLDDAGKEQLLRVQNACRRMGQLIDDLLNLSRVSRGEILHEIVDLGDLAKSILDDLRRNNPGRHVKVTVAADLTASADPKLMRIALENLLSNAWKFTSKQADAAIEIGKTTQGDQQVYYIRDNGAGFDMNYANKLFGAFQRLHSNDDYPGTGVGLATVQRIINRHGGRIWAESAVGKGATFFFALPNALVVEGVANS